MCRIDPGGVLGPPYRRPTTIAIAPRKAKPKALGNVVLVPLIGSMMSLLLICLLLLLGHVHG